MKDLVNSKIDRQNILNNKYAIAKFEKNINIDKYIWNNEKCFLKNDVAKLFDVDVRTISNYIFENEEELSENGYFVLSGNDLLKFKTENNIDKSSVTLKKSARLGMFNFRALLDLAMLMKNNQRAREIRSKMLDIVLQTLIEKSDGNLKYINRRDPSFLERSYISEKKRKEFVYTLTNFVDMNSYKYVYFTDRIYESIFREKSKEYRKILNLQAKDKTRDTMYTEVLNVVASFESGISYEIRETSKKLGRNLSKEEVDELIDKLASHPQQEIYLEDARRKMASRDKCFRNVNHKNLEEYITSVDKEDFEKFLGEKSKEFKKQIEEHKAVLERMKDK